MTKPQKFNERVQALASEAGAEVKSARDELMTLLEKGEAIRERLAALGINTRINLHKHFNAKLTDVQMVAEWTFTL